MPAAPLIADSLTRNFGTRLAVSELSLSVEAGEIISLLGPNGAGKTTTMRMLAGLILPSSGRISINGQMDDEGFSPRRAAASARRSIGLLTEAPGLWERLSVQMNLLTYARLHGLVPPQRHVDEVLNLVDLADRAGDLCGALSKGLKQRVAIARALIHKPRVVLLDEPTSGLDPASARHIRDVILKLRRDGCSVLVSTHNLAEAEELSDRIAILRTRLLALGTPAVLRAQAADARVSIDVEGEASKWIPVMREASVEDVDAVAGRLSIRLADAARVPDVVSALAAAGARITGVKPEQRTLEEVYLGLVGDQVKW